MLIFNVTCLELLNSLHLAGFHACIARNLDELPREHPMHRLLALELLQVAEKHVEKDESSIHQDDHVHRFYVLRLHVFVDVGSHLLDAGGDHAVGD